MLCLCLNTVHAQYNNLLDSVYCAMYQVLKYNYKNIEQENISCRDFLYIEDITDTNIVYLQYVNLEEIVDVSEPFTVFYEDINLERDFSMYMFDYCGSNPPDAFILIQVYSNFYIFHRYTDINLIIHFLSYTKTKYPDIITDSMFFYYVNKIVGEHLLWYKPLGDNIYYRPSSSVASKVFNKNNSTNNAIKTTKKKSKF